MNYLIDTNILVRSIEAGHPRQQTARNAVAALLARQEALYLTPQNWVEFWVVATRPADANGLALPPAQAAAELANFQTAFKLAPDLPAIAAEWQRLVTTYGIVGRQAHDARLAAAMLVHGLTHVLTFDPRGFRRYTAGEGITVVDPASMVAPPPPAPVPPGSTP